MFFTSWWYSDSFRFGNIWYFGFWGFLECSPNDRLTVRTFLNSICKLQPSHSVQFTFTLLFISIGSLSFSQHIPFPEHMIKFMSSADVKLDKGFRFLYILDEHLKWSVFLNNFYRGCPRFYKLRQLCSFLWSFIQGVVQEYKTVSFWFLWVFVYSFRNNTPLF